MASEQQLAAGSGMHVTPRQAQILGLVASGLSDKEIASHLGISPRTIQSHLDRLYLEHGLHKRAAAVAAWLRDRTRLGS
jgi:DNA-binding NarL/FixJ family response regulator